MEFPLFGEVYFSKIPTSSLRSGWPTFSPFKKVKSLVYSNKIGNFLSWAPSALFGGKTPFTYGRIHFCTFVHFISFIGKWNLFFI